MSGSEEAADRTFTVRVGQCDNTAMLTTRRLFLRQTVHPLAICLASAVQHKAAPRQSHLSVDDIATFRNDLLTRVNTERLLAGASALKIDEMACYVADQHALDMVTGKFLSHWGTDVANHITVTAALEGFMPFRKMSLRPAIWKSEALSTSA